MSTLENKGLKQIFKKSQGGLKALILLSLLFLISSCGGSGSDDPTPPTNVNPLTALSVSNISLSPSFSPTVNNYTTTVPFSTTSITLQATVISGASVTVNGAVFNGSGSFDLAVGSNAFSIVVTNSGTSQTYTVTVTREAASTDAELSSLVVSSGSLSPAFTSQTFTYGVSVNNETTSITVTPTSNDSNSSIMLNGSVVASGSASGAIALSVGDNPIDIIVTAEDGTTTQTYTVTITRLAPLSNDADLSNLSLSVGSLDPAFNAATLTYSASVSFTTTSITVTPVLSDTNASVTVNGTLADSGTASDSINLDEGDNTITLVVLAEDDTTTQTYTVVVTRQGAEAFAQQAYIKASNTGADDEFGFSVALNGDTLVVGARFEASNAIGINSDEQGNNDTLSSGAVYVFTRSNDTWTQQAYIKASNTGVSDLFGFSVALDGDTLAVGAVWESSNATGINSGGQADNSATNSGAVYIFTRSNNTWIQEAYIKASNTFAFDRFGWSVALDGDTLAVAASEEASNATGINSGGQANNDAALSGAVYVFTRSNNTWTQQAYIKASNTDTGDYFGSSVALNDDTLAVGSRQEASNATGINSGGQANNDAALSGAVYVFTRSNSNWTQQAYIKASNTDANDLFGYSVALIGDTLAVGAWGEASNAMGVEDNNNLPKSGAVYIFTRSNNTWAQQAHIKASNPGRDDFFGGSIALNGGTLAVGATGEEGIGGNGSGAVYVFTGSNSTWTQQTYIKASNFGLGDLFGNSVALNGDTLAVGAYLEDSNAIDIDGDQGDNSAVDSGATYLFEIPPNG